jgi:hypothetical protein
MSPSSAGRRVEGAAAGAPRRLALCLASLLALGCAAAPPPRPGAAPAVARTPVVLVPGFTGTALVDATTGEVEWGTGPRLLSPHDRGHRLALPLADAGPPRLRAGEIIGRLRALGGLLRKPIYDPLIDSFAAAGWVPGSLGAPRPGDTFFTFPYDWRQDLVRTAGELLAGLQRLRHVRGEPRLRVDLVCQSSGAHLCRYLLKHGAATLDEVEAGGGGLPPEIAIRRVALVGASNGGSLRMLAMLHRGRRYLPGGRRFAPETVFTFPSLYQDLPADAAGLFLSPAGEPLPVDLYDAATWRAYGWSIFAPAVARRLSRQPAGGPLGDAGDRLPFLRRRLADARRFQRALAADRELGGTRLLLVQGDAHPTMRRAVLARAGNGWRLRFGREGAAGRRHLLPLLVAPGDEHATLRSQNALAPRELAALAAPPLRTRGSHFEMILEPATLAWLTAVLLAPDGAPETPGGG